jgi:hypothetical protein
MGQAHPGYAPKPVSDGFTIYPQARSIGVALCNLKESEAVANRACCANEGRRRAFLAA